MLKTDRCPKTNSPRNTSRVHDSEVEHHHQSKMCSKIEYTNVHVRMRFLEN